ncbi:MAG: cobalamin B12-binding domain-containing protein [Eubacteriales bacterium]
MDGLDEFRMYLESGNKEACVSFGLDGLASGKLDIRSLYEGYLKVGLDRLTCDMKEKDLCIWKEHISTAIVRTIIECAYPYVIRERDKRGSTKKGKSVVLCPEGEYHEVGARMITDYLTILGFDALFLGSSTPKEEVLRAVQVLDLDLIALSVTNYYNLVAAKKMVDVIRSKAGKKVCIIAGGQAFESNAGACTQINADRLVRSFEDLESIETLLKKGGDV